MDRDELAVGDLRIVEHDGAVTAIEYSPFRPSSSGRPLGDRPTTTPCSSRRWRS